MASFNDGQDAIVFLSVDSAWLAADNPQFVYLQHYSAEIFLASPAMEMARQVGDVRFLLLDLSRWRHDKQGAIVDLFALSNHAHTIYDSIKTVKNIKTQQYYECLKKWAGNVLIIERLDISPDYRHLKIGETALNEVTSKMHRESQIILTDPTQQSVKLADAYDALFLPLTLDKRRDTNMEKNYRKSLRHAGFQYLVGSGIFARASDDLVARMQSETDSSKA